MPAIDVHAHFTTPEYLAFIEKHGASLEDGFPLPSWDAERHLAFMDRAGIEWSLLSLSSPQPYFAGEEEASVAVCRELNDVAAGVKHEHAGRFGFAACLPLPNVEAAAEEATRALDELGADAVKFASNSRGLYLGDTSLEPLMAELDRRHAVCIIHPHRPEPIQEGVFSAGPVPLFEFLADTTRAVLNLIATGTVLRYPNVRWVVPHSGSFLPNIYDRFLGISKILVPQGLMEDVDVAASFERLYFDLSGNPAPHLLSWLLTVTSPEHVLYGSDYSFTPEPQIEANLAALRQMLAREDLAGHSQAILHDNAAELFGL
jgi:6-methylsalicylate decarboxylase